MTESENVIFGDKGFLGFGVPAKYGFAGLFRGIFSKIPIIKQKQ